MIRLLCHTLLPAPVFTLRLRRIHQLLNVTTIYIIKIGLLSVWPVLLSTLCSQHPVPTHPSPQRSTLLCWGWGDGWMGTGCWYSGLTHCSGSTHHSISNLKQLMIPYQLLQQQAARRCATLQHEDSVDIGMLWACWLWHRLSLASRCLRTR